MLEITCTLIFSTIVLLLLCAAATKVFSNYFHPENRWWEEDECEADETIQIPSNFTDYR